MKKSVYADNAATEQMPKQIQNVYLDALKNYWGNASSGHGIGAEAAIAMHKARRMIAESINAYQREIYFCSTGSEADTMAILSALENNKGRRKVVTTNIEHSAVLETLKAAKEKGLIDGIKYISPSVNGEIQYKDIEYAVDENTALVTVQWVNNETGYVLPIKEIANICKKKGAILHVDATQAAGKIDIDVRHYPIDFLTFAGHKFGSAKGASCLYAWNGYKVFPLVYGGGQENGARAGTENVPAIVSMAHALKYSSKRKGKLVELYEYTVNKLREAIPDVHIIEYPIGKRSWNIISARIDGLYGEELVAALSAYGVYVSAGSACKGKSEASHVLMAMGYTEEQAKSTIRISWCTENTLSDVDTLVKTMKICVERLRASK